MAELADARDLGSRGQPWGFDSPLSHCDARRAALTPHGRRRSVTLEELDSGPQAAPGRDPRRRRCRRSSIARSRCVGRQARLPGFRPGQGAASRARAHVRRRRCAARCSVVWSRSRSTTRSTSTSSPSSARPRSTPTTLDAGRGAALLGHRRRPAGDRARRPRRARGRAARRRPSTDEDVERVLELAARVGRAAPTDRGSHDRRGGRRRHAST